MIAGPNQHYDHETLERLLNEDLPHEEAQRVECHLNQCSRCQSEIEDIAGHRQWWNETVDVLSSSTVRSQATTSNEPVPFRRPSDASVEWIRPLLDRSLVGSQGLGRIDQYEVLEVIGQGGMGVVLRGLDPELNRPVAIKVLSPHLAGVGAARARFMREAQAAATVVHPSIVPIYSVVTSSRLPYIVMPCISGGNLQERIDREGPLELGEVLRIGVQVAEGLSAAHGHSLIHRDIKPANILMEEGNGRVLISDFGLARALDDATLTISGMIAGTPQYMSPEQARGELIDARSDLFSLGSLLYALATGRPPYRAESPLAVLRKISETKPKPIHHVNELVPKWFDTLIGKLMAMHPSQRIASAEAAANLLREAHAHVRNPAVNTIPSALSSRRPSRTTIATAFGAACLIPVSLLGFAWQWMPEAPSTRSIVDPASPATRQLDAANMTISPAHLASEWDWNSRLVGDELESIAMKLNLLEHSMSNSYDSGFDNVIPIPAKSNDEQ